MSLKVSRLETVKDVDCHLCGDCVASCPEKNTLSITGNKFIAKDSVGKRNTLLWIPAAAVVILVLAGLGFSSQVQIPTISLKWGDDNQMTEAGIYEQAGLTSIKCFGSSMSFANHMKELPGVLGVETYVGSHSVRVYYDKNASTSEDIKRAIFSPVKRLFMAPEIGVGRISVLDARIDQFFDPNDAMLLSTRFSQHKGILAMQTLFGEPVEALIYYDPEKITSDIIISLIEERRVEWDVEGEKQVAKTDFKVASHKDIEPVSLKEYLTSLYEPVSMTFNSYEKHDSAELEIAEFPFIEGANPLLIDLPWYLLSHVSNNRGVVSFEMVPSDEGFKIRLKYIKGFTTLEDIKKHMNNETLIVHLSDGTVQVVPNPYKFI
jgi:ferredoxin